MLEFDFLIVGAGFSGAVLAERLVNELDATVLIVEKRHHIAGNAHDAYDNAGILIHKYGPHYFRTNSDRIKDYLSQFTEWHPVEYKILSWTQDKFWNFPINLNTFEQLVGHESTSEEMQKTLEEWRVPIEDPQNSEEVIVSQVGWDLYNMFFKNYTLKQWKRDPKDLDASVTGRIPIRTNRDDRYLAEKFQALPKHGYTRMFERILDHPKIKLMLNTDYREILGGVQFKHMIYTGPIDLFYDHRFGELPYRSLRFEPETLEQEYYQPAMQVNYPNDYDFTRIVEIKHATGQKSPYTTIVREYPESVGDPYYPIPAPEPHALFQRYNALAEAEDRVSFVGRLANYRYYNMDQCVGAALKQFDKLKEQIDDIRHRDAITTVYDV